MPTAQLYVDSDSQPNNASTLPSVQQIRKSITDMDIEITKTIIIANREQERQLGNVDLQFSYTLIKLHDSPGKNAMDIAISCEVGDSFDRKDTPDIYIIASNDNDFKYIVQKCNSKGKECWGIVNGVVDIHYFDNLSYRDNYFQKLSIVITTLLSDSDDRLLKSVVIIKLMNDEHNLKHMNLIEKKFRKVMKEWKTLNNSNCEKLKDGVYKF